MKPSTTSTKAMSEQSLQQLVVKAYIKKTVQWTEKNMNRIIIIVGDPGTGKSYTALTYMYWFYSIKYGHKIRPNEFPFDNITFDPLDFLNRVDGQEGEVIMFDEGGVGANARRWYTKANIAMSEVIQTMRFKRHIILVTVPRLRMVDKHLRDLAHELHTLPGIRKKNHNLVHIRELMYNSTSDESSRMYPAFAVYTNGRPKIVYLKALWVPSPPSWLAQEYEKRSQAYKNQVLQEAKEKIMEGSGELTADVIDQKVAKLLDLFVKYPGMAVGAVTERGGTAKFSSYRLKRQFPDIVPKDYAKPIAEELNELLLGARGGMPVMDYYGFLQSGEFEKKVKEVMVSYGVGKA